MAREICPKCKRELKVTKDGRYPKHRIPRANYSRRYGLAGCPYSWRKVEAGMASGKISNDKLDRALDRLYDVLSKNPPGTSYQIRLERAKKWQRARSGDPEGDNSKK